MSFIPTLIKKRPLVYSIRWNNMDLVFAQFAKSLLAVDAVNYTFALETTFAFFLETILLWLFYFLLNWFDD